MPKRAVQPNGKKSKQHDLTKAVPRKRPAKAATGTVFQLKITLADIRPPIWRRVQTKDCTLAQLHDIIQVSMGWHESHLHLFQIGEDHYGDLGQWPKNYLDDLETLNERKLKLSQIAGQGVKKFTYEYDMGDGWRHTILIEKTVPAEAGVKYPRCIGGARACPPEDCGGPWGYGDFVNAIQNPKHKQHRELLEWVGGEFDPAEFDLEGVNEALQEVR